MCMGGACASLYTVVYEVSACVLLIIQFLTVLATVRSLGLQELAPVTA